MNITMTQQIFEQIESTELIDLRNQLYESAIRYARIRTEWYLSTIEEKRRLSGARRMAHNCIIDDCNILSRNMAKIGEDVSWREDLGCDRRSIGDFACYLHCILGINSG